MAKFNLDDLGIETNFRLATIVPGVNDRFLAIKSSNFPRPGESTIIPIANREKTDFGY